MKSTPKLTIRFKTRKQLEDARAAAKVRDMSLNKWCVMAIEYVAFAEREREKAKEPK